MRSASLLFFLSALSLSGFLARAQQSRIYYDKKWVQLSTADNAAYYREYAPEAAQIKVTDYYINGTVQMTGALTISDSLKTGDYVYYNEAGAVQDQEHFLNGKKDGISKSFYPGGALAYEALYREGFRSGYCKAYDSTGGLLFKEYYIEDPERVRQLLAADTMQTGENSEGLQDGKSYYYYANGTLASEELFRDGKFLSANFFDASGRVVYYDHEAGSTLLHPVFLKGDYIAYLSRQVRYPKDAQKKRISGKVYVDFVIETDGAVSMVTVSKPVHPLLDEAATEAVKATSGLWKPGKRHNLPTRVRYSVPIYFNLK